MTDKTDKVLDACWKRYPTLFTDVSEALDTLLDTLIECAKKNGVSEAVARDSYIDWLIFRMRDGSFLTWAVP